MSHPANLPFVLTKATGWPHFWQRLMKLPTDDSGWSSKKSKHRAGNALVNHSLPALLSKLETKHEVFRDTYNVWREENWQRICSHSLMFRFDCLDIEYPESMVRWTKPGSTQKIQLSMWATCESCSISTEIPGSFSGSHCSASPLVALPIWKPTLLMLSIMIQLFLVNICFRFSERLMNMESWGNL